MKRLIEIQRELKAPKNQYNSFGKYNYRSCEDILEGVKPLLEKTKTSLIISDEIVMIGDRYYVKAIATLYGEDGAVIAVNSAFAREEENKKGMDGSQVTGASSSYARKYALNGLLLIDDTKDADTDQFTQKVNQPSANKVDVTIIQSFGEKAVAYIEKSYKKSINELTSKEVEMAVQHLRELQQQKNLKQQAQEVSNQYANTDVDFNNL